MSGFYTQSMDTLFQAISAIQSPEVCRAFLEDLCTIKELQDMAQRFDTAIALSEGKNYQQITSQLGVSTATISRVSRCLNYGSGGYKMAIETIGEARNTDGN